MGADLARADLLLDQAGHAALQVGRVVLHIYDDRGGVQPPVKYTIQFWTGTAWQDGPLTRAVREGGQGVPTLRTGMRSASA